MPLSESDSTTVSANPSTMEVDKEDTGRTKAASVKTSGIAPKTASVKTSEIAPKTASVKTSGSAPKTKQKIWRTVRTAFCLPSRQAATASTTNTSKEGAEEEEDAKTDSDTNNDSDNDDDQTMKSEFKYLDRKYDEQENPYYIERTKAEATGDKNKKDKWQKFAFCMVRQYDEDDDLENTVMRVHPLPLCQLLKDVIGDYPTNPINLDDCEISSPYESLFHYRKQLKFEGLQRFDKPGEEDSLKQLNLLLEWIDTHFELAIVAHDRLLASTDSKALAYDKIWTIFRPGTIIYAKANNEPRAFRVSSYYYNEDASDHPGLYISGRYIDYDGQEFGEKLVHLRIPKFTGIRDVTSHDVVPLEYVEDADDLRARLVARGKRFEELAPGQNFVQYDGIAVKESAVRPGAYIRYDATGRAMIDCKTYHRIDANDSFYVRPFAKKDQTRPDGKLTEEDHLLANAFVRGYSLTAKEFVELGLDKITPITWNTKCFDGLVLDADIKKTVQALVSTHAQGAVEDGFDDIVKGKGLGLVCVLHGPPGVGKTMTAECVAEYVQRPLFMVSSGDLGSTSSQLDEKLTSIMDMTSTWRAVLLIDEADIFLEQRALHDMHRNAMVSVFLRVLEYYAGILFLTTNRVATFDDAFKSRIHIPIRYTDLSPASRLQIWRNLIAKVPGSVTLSEKEYQKLAENDLNGRQIKNVIKAAEALARFDGEVLQFGQLQQVTKIQSTFEKDLTSFGEIDYTAPGSAKRFGASGSLYS